MVETEIFTLINQERVDRGLPKLNGDTKLEGIAKEWSDELIQSGVFIQW